MPHIQIRCPKCGKVTGIAANVHDDAFVCHACGSRLPRGQVAPSTGRLRLKDTTAPGASQPAGDARAAAHAQPDIIQAARDDAARRFRKRAFQWSPVHTGFLLFVLIGAVFGTARYGGVLPAEYLAYSSRFGPLILLALHVVVLLKAFSDSIFQGILCLFIPFYSLYYLFAVADDFVLRGVVAGVLVGVGQDGAMMVQEHASGVIDAVNAWIASGGG